MNDKRDTFRADAQQTLYPVLDPADQACMRRIADDYRLTFQELRILAVAARDLRMWREQPLDAWWAAAEEGTPLKGIQRKKKLLRQLNDRLEALRREANLYPGDGLAGPPPTKLTLVDERSDRKLLGHCPVASADTLCCNLLTLDAVQNCGFGCSYCTIQSFYGDTIVFDPDLRDKLDQLELAPKRFYHIGTGQSSDSLMWGDQGGMLTNLCDFADAHPNLLLEFKTKSKNVQFFMKHDVPSNIVCSWSLATPTLIANEEQYTADLEQRLRAARKVADRGIRLGFHFHPIVHYDNWRRDYGRVVSQLLERFQPSEVLFVSFGAVTYIKPVIAAIRKRGGESKILEMPLEKTAKGKLSYPDALKDELFAGVYERFAPWHDRVFFYLCMEEPAFWERLFGHAYADNAAFEAALAQAAADMGMVRLADR